MKNLINPFVHVAKENMVDTIMQLFGAPYVNPMFNSEFVGAWYFHNHVNCNDEHAVYLMGGEL